MKILLAVILLVATSCSHLSTSGEHSNPLLSTETQTKWKRVRARVTFYAPAPPWGSKVACQDTRYAVRGETVAAHPDFPFGTEIRIPALHGEIDDDALFVVHDRGSAVTKKAASGGDEYVFDVFCSTASEMRRLANEIDDYTWVLIKR